MVLYYRDAEKEWRAGTQGRDFILECLCFYMAAKAEDAAASLVLRVCQGMQGEKEQLCLEPSVSCHRSGPASQARTKPAHSYKLVPLWQVINLSLWGTESLCPFSQTLGSCTRITAAFRFPLGKALLSQGSLIMRPESATQSSRTRNDVRANCQE